MSDPTCSRCGRPMPPTEAVADETVLTEEEFRIVEYIVRRYGLVEPPTSPPSGVDMPEIVVPSAGFLTDPDNEERFICMGCATQDELDDLSLLELRVAGATDEDDLDDDA